MSDEPSPSIEWEIPIDGGAEGSREEPPSVDEFHRILASPRRRIVLLYLSGRPEERVPFDELVEVVVEHEDPQCEPASHRLRVETDLHHVHLPKLAGAGVVKYDPGTEAVTYEPQRALESLLATSIDVESETG